MSYSSYIIGCEPEKLNKILKELKPDEEYEFEIEEVWLNLDSDFLIIHKPLNPKWKYIAIHEHCSWADDIYRYLVEECGDEFIFAKTTF